MCRRLVGRRSLLGAALAIAALLAPLPIPTATSGAAAAGFFGVVPQEEPAEGELARMGSLGLTLRMPVYWALLEPQRGSYEFAGLDRSVVAAARHGVRVLPFVYGSPDWAAPGAAFPPLRREARAAWRRLLVRLVQRYGPRGSLWDGSVRRLPIRRWQIWNEPNFRLFWRPRPSARGYARLLRASARAIRSVDRGARIVAAGVAPVEDGPWPWTFMRRLYRVPWASRHFDVAALHPYATSLRSMAYQLRRVRIEMARGGDRAKPLLVTEFGVASDGAFDNPFDKGRRGQAGFLRRSYRMLLRRRADWRLAGAYWFTWRDGAAHDRACVFCQHAGLFDRRGAAKPAWGAFRRLAARHGPAVR